MPRETRFERKGNLVSTQRTQTRLAELQDGTAELGGVG
jgi:hypothetical protein